MKHLLFLLFAFFRLSTISAYALNDSIESAPAISETRITERTTLCGAGTANVLDSYLSPLEYTGPDFIVLHRTERLARWGKGRVMTVSLYDGHFAYLHSPTDDGKEWDGELTAAGGWHYRFVANDHWTVDGGGLIEGSGGFTYNTRNGNNPAQGRLGVALLASVSAKYRFPLFRHLATAAITFDTPLIGGQFSPGYGRSYYEIFSLGHNDGVIHFTHPGNAPTFRLSADLTLPVLGAGVTIGYLGDIRQSRLGGLKRHAWRHTVMIGYTRRLRLIR